MNAENLNSKAYFAGGCFWCVEECLEKSAGVSSVISGYIGDEKEKPTYEKVSKHKLKYREAVLVNYDKSKISYQQLTADFLRCIDPTDSKGQFFDRGFIYEPVIFFESENQKKSSLALIKDLNKSKLFKKDAKVKLENFSKFYQAEKYHQDYYKTNKQNYNNYKKGSGRADFINKYFKEFKFSFEN